MLTTFDGLALSVLFIAYLFGRGRGLTWQVAGFSSIGLGCLAARRYADPVAQIFGVEGQGPQRFLIWVLIYAALACAIHVVGAKVRRFLKARDLDELDRHLGGALGAVEGAALFALATLIALTLAPQLRSRILATPSGRGIAVLARQLGPILPPEVHGALASVQAQAQATVVPRRAPLAAPRRTKKRTLHRQAAGRVSAPTRARQAGFQRAGHDDEPADEAALGADHLPPMISSPSETTSGPR